MDYIKKKIKCNFLTDLKIILITNYSLLVLVNLTGTFNLAKKNQTNHNNNSTINISNQYEQILTIKILNRSAYITQFKLFIHILINYFFFSVFNLIT